MNFQAANEAARASSGKLNETGHIWHGLSDVKKPLRVLLLARRFKMPYRVLRCAAATGAHVFVLGGRQAHRLRYSRFCRDFFQTLQIIDGSPNPTLVAEINEHCARLRIDMVMAGDAPSTRSLIQLKDAIHARCFPMPTLVQFDTLNDKWRFGQICAAFGIDYPESRLFPTLELLKQEISLNGIAVPSMAKPLAMDSGDGCIKMTPDDCVAKLSRIAYEPILLQEFIEGEDIGASVFCRGGEIKAFIAHRYEKDIYQSFYDAGIYENLQRVMANFRADGVFNFDMRRTADGRIIFLECNPRIYFKIAMSMIAGVNFVACGFQNGGAVEPDIKYEPKIARFPKAFLLRAARFRRLEPESWCALDFVLQDPVPYALELLGCYEPRPRFTPQRNSAGSSD